MKHTRLFVLLKTVAAILMTATACSAQQKPENNTPKNLIRQIQSISISKQHEMSWVVTVGTMENGVYVPLKESDQVYTISFHKAEMTFNGKTLKFSHAEAKALDDAMENLFIYAAKSIIWFEDGGDKPDDSPKPYRAGTKATQKNSEKDIHKIPEKLDQLLLKLEKMASQQKHGGG